MKAVIMCIVCCVIIIKIIYIAVHIHTHIIADAKVPVMCITIKLCA